LPNIESMVQSAQREVLESFRKEFDRKRCQAKSDHQSSLLPEDFPKTSRLGASPGPIHELVIRNVPSKAAEISQWYQERFGGGGSRPRRIGIVALARKLLIALWRWCEQDLLPEGAQLRVS
jgi:hypothetical protein